MFLARHAAASVLVAVALAIVAGVFAFARPHYVPELQPREYDMKTRKHFTVQQVRAVFAAHGFTLRNGDLTRWTRTPGAWMQPLEHASGVEAMVFGPRAKVSWGETAHAPLSVFTANVAVSYYGTSDDVLRRAKAAVAELR